MKPSARLLKDSRPGFQRAGRAQTRLRLLFLHVYFPSRCRRPALSSPSGPALPADPRPVWDRVLPPFDTLPPVPVQAELLSITTSFVVIFHIGGRRQQYQACALFWVELRGFRSRLDPSASPVCVVQADAKIAPRGCALWRIKSALFVYAALASSIFPERARTLPMLL